MIKLYHRWLFIKEEDNQPVGSQLDTPRDRNHRPPSQLSLVAVEVELPEVHSCRQVHRKALEEVSLELWRRSVAVEVWLELWRRSVAEALGEVEWGVCYRTVQEEVWLERSPCSHRDPGTAPLSCRWQPRGGVESEMEMKITTGRWT